MSVRFVHGLLVKQTELTVNPTLCVDGCGPNTTIGTFSSYCDAVAFSHKKGNYGQDAKVRTVVLKICESLTEIEKLNKDNIKEKALAKLTVEERKALGV